LFIKVKYETKTETYTFLKILITMLFAVYNFQEDNLRIKKKRSHWSFNTDKIVNYIFSLIQLVLSNYTINKTDLEIIYQELSKHYHHNHHNSDTDFDNQHQLSQNKVQNYIELLKVILFFLLSFN